MYENERLSLHLGKLLYFLSCLELIILLPGSINRFQNYESEFSQMFWPTRTSLLFVVYCLLSFFIVDCLIRWTRWIFLKDMLHHTMIQVLNWTKVIDQMGSSFSRQWSQCFNLIKRRRKCNYSLTSFWFLLSLEREKQDWKAFKSYARSMLYKRLNFDWHLSIQWLPDGCLCVSLKKIL